MVLSPLVEALSVVLWTRVPISWCGVVDMAVLGLVLSFSWAGELFNLVVEAGADTLLGVPLPCWPGVVEISVRGLVVS